MRLIITRHGETIENQEGIMQGHLHGTLSELGKEQARIVAERLKDEKIDYIYSSDLARASDTTREISKFHPDVPIEFTQELRERNLGEFQGKKKSELGFSIRHFLSTSLEIKEGETMEQLYERAKTFLDKVIHRHNGDCVLFVGHNGIDKSIIAVITNKKFEEIPSMENLKNTGISIYEIDEDKNHKVHLFNCVKHLD